MVVDYYGADGLLKRPIFLFHFFFRSDYGSLRRVCHRGNTHTHKYLPKTFTEKAVREKVASVEIVCGTTDNSQDNDSHLVSSVSWIILNREHKPGSNIHRVRGQRATIELLGSKQQHQQ